MSIDCLRNGYATQETSIGQAKCEPEPTIEVASMRRRRCPSRDPTCPYKPTTTHAPFRTQCPSAQAFGRRPVMDVSITSRNQQPERPSTPRQARNEPTCTQNRNLDPPIERQRFSSQNRRTARQHQAVVADKKPCRTRPAPGGHLACTAQHVIRSS